MSKHLAVYVGSKGNQYNITQGDDGVVYCNCQGWKMRKNCKHLLDYTINSARQAQSVMSPEQIQHTEERKEIIETLNGDEKLANAMDIAIQMMGGSR